MAASIHQGTIDKLKSIGSLEEAVVLQVTELQENNGKLKCQFSDGGRENISGLITSQVHTKKQLPTWKRACQSGRH